MKGRTVSISPVHTAFSWRVNAAIHGCTQTGVAVPIKLDSQKQATHWIRPLSSGLPTPGLDDSLRHLIAVSITFTRESSSPMRAHSYNELDCILSCSLTSTHVRLTKATRSTCSSQTGQLRHRDLKPRLRPHSHMVDPGLSRPLCTPAHCAPVRPWPTRREQDASSQPSLSPFSGSAAQQTRRPRLPQEGLASARRRVPAAPSRHHHPASQRRGRGHWLATPLPKGSPRLLGL